jgi:hypothetical protein
VQLTIRWLGMQSAARGGISAPEDRKPHERRARRERECGSLTAPPLQFHAFNFRSVVNQATGCARLRARPADLYRRGSAPRASVAQTAWAAARLRGRCRPRAAYLQGTTAVATVAASGRVSASVTRSHTDCSCIILLVGRACAPRPPAARRTAAFAPTLPLSRPVSDRRSRDAAAGYGGNDHIVRAHTAAGTEQRGAPPPAQCMFTRRTIEEARRGGASLSEQRGHGGAANQRRHG